MVRVKTFTATDVEYLGKKIEEFLSNDKEVISLAYAPEVTKANEHVNAPGQAKFLRSYISIYSAILIYRQH